MPANVASRSLVKRPSRLWGWLRALETGCQVALLIGLLSFGIRHWIVTSRLEAEFAKLDRTDPGWRLQDIEAARAVVPDEENSALRVTDIGERLPWLPKPWIEEDFATKLQDVPPQNRLAPEQLAHLIARVKDVGPILEDARGISALSRGRYPIVYARNPWDTLLEAQQKSRRVLQLLDLDAMCRAEADDLHGALTSCRAELNVGRAIGDEPFAISQLIRVAEVMIACKTAGRILAQGEPPPDDLSKLQALLEVEDAHPYWQIVCRGERAVDNAGLEAVESGGITLSEWGGSRPDWQDYWFAPVLQDNVRAVHAQLFTYMARLQAAAELPAPLSDPASQQIWHEIRQNGMNVALVTLPALQKLAVACDRWHATLRCTTAALAAERYRHSHGDWPPSLDVVTPDLLPAVPIDPFTGDPLFYRRREDGVVIYSVGPDGKDDGGINLTPSTTEPGTDLGVRLWDVAKRRQPPVPPK
jgi:hypothetical protein